MSAHVPAWKRLGLKLKGSSSAEAIPSSAGPNSRAKPSPQTPNAHQTRVNGSPASALKRKQPGSLSTPNAVTAQTPNKKPRREGQSAADQGTPSSLKKSVSFAGDTKDSAKEKAKPKKAKSKKPKKASSTAKSDFSLEPSLVYIRQWHTERDSWKFNKNHQTLLIKYLFDGDKVPSADIPIFYQYIRDLKGFVRTRLRETAAEIKKKDMEAGAGAFPATLKDKETKQKEYEETISRFLQDLQQHQQRRQSNSDFLKNANGKRTLDEVEYVLRVATPEIKQRLLKRIRAELVVDELSDSEESSTSAASEGAATTATGTSSSSASSGRDTTTPTTAVAAGTTTTTTTAGRSDGSQQPAKRRRLRNVRTAIGDDDSSSSSSESESESGDSGSEESSSESESDEDEEMGLAPDGAGAAAESSSSSSSSSEAESDEEGESESGSSSSDED